MEYGRGYRYMVPDDGIQLNRGYATGEKNMANKATKDWKNTKEGTSDGRKESEQHPVPKVFNNVPRFAQNLLNCLKGRLLVVDFNPETTWKIVYKSYG